MGGHMGPPLRDKEAAAVFSITLICMGKCKEKFYIAAAEEYAKRMKAYCDFRR